MIFFFFLPTLAVVAKYLLSRKSVSTVSDCCA